MNPVLFFMIMSLSKVTNIPPIGSDFFIFDNNNNIIFDNGNRAITD